MHVGKLGLENFLLKITLLNIQIQFSYNFIFCMLVKILNKMKVCNSLLIKSIKVSIISAKHRLRTYTIINNNNVYTTQTHYL